MLIPRQLLASGSICVLLLNLCVKGEAQVVVTASKDRFILGNYVTFTAQVTEPNATVQSVLWEAKCNDGTYIEMPNESNYTSDFVFNTDCIAVEGTHTNRFSAIVTIPAGYGEVSSIITGKKTVTCYPPDDYEWILDANSTGFPTMTIMNKVRWFKRGTPATPTSPAIPDELMGDCFDTCTQEKIQYSVFESTGLSSDWEPLDCGDTATFYFDKSHTYDVRTVIAEAGSDFEKAAVGDMFFSWYQKVRFRMVKCDGTNKWFTTQLVRFRMVKTGLQSFKVEKF